jgi:hypothetical protein
VVLTKEGRKLCVWLPEPVYLRLKAAALEQRRPVSEIVAERVDIDPPRREHDEALPAAN